MATKKLGALPLLCPDKVRPSLRRVGKNGTPTQQELPRLIGDLGATPSSGTQRLSGIVDPDLKALAASCGQRSALGPLDLRSAAFYTR
jgi:hypothetical protein